jgi:hypothetical protein
MGGFFIFRGSAAMSADFQIIQLTIGEEALKNLNNRCRNQLVGCMHAHNELTVFNRILMYSLNNPANSELERSAQSVQMWCVLQVLAAKLVEAWKMLDERFLSATPEDPAIGSLAPEQRQSLDWLKNYFGVGKSMFKEKSLRMIRDKTAFHYDKINLDCAVDNLAEQENTVYVAEHPANSLYYLGSVLVFRSAFEMIANKASNSSGDSHSALASKGASIAMDDARYANLHMHVLLYGLIKTLLEGALGQPLETLDLVHFDVREAPDPDLVNLPTFVDMAVS